jgi:hypothetical protein
MANMILWDTEIPAGRSATQMLINNDMYQMYFMVHDADGNDICCVPVNFSVMTPPATPYALRMASLGDDRFIKRIDRTNKRNEIIEIEQEAWDRYYDLSSDMEV